MFYLVVLFAVLRLGVHVENSFLETVLPLRWSETFRMS